MKIIVVGCGKIGTGLIGSLVEEGHDVTAVDIDPDVIGDITNAYDVMTVIGNGVDCDTLEEAGARSARLLIAVTPRDEVNILCCLLSRRMGTHHAVARVEDPNSSDRELAFIKKHTSVSMFLNPSKLVAEELANMLKLPSGIRAEYFARRKFEMIQLKVKADSPLRGLSLSEMRQVYKGQYLVLAAARGDKVVVPKGPFVLESGDEILIGAKREGIEFLLKELGYWTNATKSVMIVGGSRTAYFLATSLTKQKVKVKIIEQDRKHCLELCDLIPDASIIQGDGSRRELLEEEGLGSVDALVTLTGIDEQNLLMTIFAQKNHVRRALCKIDREEFTELASDMDVDSFVSPGSLVNNNVIRYARAIENSEGSKMETLYRLMDDKLEASEFIVQPGFEYEDMTLAELSKRMKENILIGGIQRDNVLIIPGGDDVIQVGDRVIVVAANQPIRDLTDIMKED
ncbi:MAG: Trk system potassium transporter TrkA [Lachnospiraceae bacterium]|nr:Trk system potassium transporter TrkA [Lachnospiraceae bacterium]